MITDVSALGIGLGESQLFREITLLFTGTAAGTKLALHPMQAGASSKCAIMVGNGVANLLSASEAAKIAEGDSSKRASPVVQAELDAIAADLVTYCSTVPAAADGALAIAFAIGGLTGSAQVLCAELEWSTVSSTGVNSSLKLRNDSSAKVANSSTNPIPSTSKLVVFPSAGVVCGVFTLKDVTDVPGVGAPVTLRLFVKV
jgi:hypothetical protein